MPDPIVDQNSPLFQDSAQNFSKFTTWGTGITTLGAAVVALVKGFQGNVNPAIAVGALAVVGVGLLAIAIVTAVDVHSRAYVAAANITASQPNQPGPNAPPQDTPVSQPNAAAALAPIAGPLYVHLSQKGTEPFRVLATRWDVKSGATAYLVVHEPECPTWVDEKLITRSESVQLAVSSSVKGRGHNADIGY